MDKCQRQLKKAGLPIVAVCLKPIDFGDEIILMSDLRPSIITYYRQILAGLEYSRSKWVFFCEHDVLYHPSHFALEPERSDTYYYNNNMWRWRYLADFFISYDQYAGVSGLCANRELLLNHYLERLKQIKERGLQDGRNPVWARRWGHEPGKPRRRGGILDERSEIWRSEYPNIDIRHPGTWTPEKMTLDSFVNKPTGWKEATIDQIPGWTKEQLWN